MENDVQYWNTEDACDAIIRKVCFFPFTVWKQVNSEQRTANECWTCFRYSIEYVRILRINSM